MLEKESRPGGPHPVHEGGGRAPLPRAPWDYTDLNPNSIYCLLGRKKSKRRIHHVLRYGAAAKPCSSSGGQIWSLFGAPERGIRRRRHHQPSSITNFMMLAAMH